jgi:hypothetical protein
MIITNAKNSVDYTRKTLETIKRWYRFKMKKMTIQKTKPVLVFDVNETLLDMTPLKETVNALLDNEQGSASGLAHYYTTPLYRIVSTSIMTLVLLRSYISYGSHFHE